MVDHKKKNNMIPNFNIVSPYILMVCHYFVCLLDWTICLCSVCWLHSLLVLQVAIVACCAHLSVRRVRFEIKDASTMKTVIGEPASNNAPLRNPPCLAI